MTEKIILLSQRYEAHGEIFDRVTIREPRWSDLMALGEPFEIQLANKQPVIIEDPKVVADYVNRCVITPTADKLVVLGIADARKVRGAVLDFFTPGVPADTSSSPTSGSGETN